MYVYSLRESGGVELYHFLVILRGKVPVKFRTLVTGDPIFKKNFQLLFMYFLNSRITQSQKAASSYQSHNKIQH